MAENEAKPNFDVARIKEYVDNPGLYTNYLYKTEPNTFLGVPVYQQFMNSYGRAPTQDEFAIYAPQVQALGHAGAMAEIAKAKLSEDNSPENINKRNQEKYLKEAPQHFDSLNQLFQSKLGRAATQDELNHFGSALASGATDSYGLSQFLEQQPEFAEGKDKAMREGLRGELAANDKRQFSEQILPSIQEAYAKQGRSFDSSGFQNAATQSAQAQNTQREGFLADLTASQYGNRQQNAYNDYANRVANQQNMANNNVMAQYQGVQNTINRANNISDFQVQQDSYNRYLSKYGKRNNGLGGMIGTGVGAGLGAFGGIQGAQLGATLGGSFGQSAQNLYGGSY